LCPWSSRQSSQRHGKGLGGIRVDEGIERLIGGSLDHNLATQAVAVVDDDLRPLPSPSGSRRLSIARSMTECALAIVADCSAMSLLAMAICARKTASCVRLRWSCIINPLRLPLNRTHLCFKIAL
jgi:hypothetical protein